MESFATSITERELVGDATMSRNYRAPAAAARVGPWQPPSFPSPADHCRLRLMLCCHTAATNRDARDVGEEEDRVSVEGE